MVLSSTEVVAAPFKLGMSPPVLWGPHYSLLHYTGTVLLICIISGPSVYFLAQHFYFTGEEAEVQGVAVVTQDHSAIE